MAAVGAATRAGTGCGGIEHVKEVYIVIVQGGEQGFQIFIQRTEFARVYRQVGIEFGGHGDYLAAFDDSRVQIVGEIEFDAPVIRSDQRLPLSQGVTHAKFTHVAIGVARPGLTGDGYDSSNAHEVTPCELVFISAKQE
ncbi:hypothetical protein Q427_05320 [Halomonas sp. BC04]|nr:hypothetical protein Q427_05320 [Halomonas sp. BC04]